MNLQANEKQAIQWRETNGYTHKNGVIVLFNGQVQGWCNQLRDPQSWQPGCIAIDEQGQQWISAGGNQYDGAESWQPIALQLADYCKNHTTRSHSPISSGIPVKKSIRPLRQRLLRKLCLMGKPDDWGVLRAPVYNRLKLYKLHNTRARRALGWLLMADYLLFFPINRLRHYLSGGL